jgi:hypothetical protein
MSDPISIINGPMLASYPGAGQPTASDARTYADLVNGVITEAWRNPETPVPVWVKAMALEVGARAARNPKGLASWTRSVDDASRTERLPDAAARAGIYLTDDERARLGGNKLRRQRYGTIRVGLGY